MQRSVAMRGMPEKRRERGESERSCYAEISWVLVVASSCSRLGRSASQALNDEVGQKFLQPPTEDVRYSQTKRMITSLGLQSYEKSFKNGLLTDGTLPLLTNSALRDGKIPPGPRLLIIKHIHRCIMHIPVILQSDYLSSTSGVSVDLDFTCWLSHLSICINLSDWKQMSYVVNIIRRSSLLHKVDLKSKFNTHAIMAKVLDDFWEAQECLNCSFSQLRCLNVIEFRGTAAELKFVDYVLAKAPALEMVNIGFRPDLVDLVSVLMKLNGLHRKLSKAKIVFAE